MPEKKKTISDNKSKSTSEKKQETLETISDELKSMNTNMSYWKSMLRGFLTGVAQILGATVGATVIFFLISYSLRKAEQVPFIDSVLEKSQLVELVREGVEKYYDNND